MTSDQPDILTAAADAGYQRGLITGQLAGLGRARALLLLAQRTTKTQKNVWELIAEFERLLAQRERAIMAQLETTKGES